MHTTFLKKRTCSNNVVTYMLDLYNFQKTLYYNHNIMQSTSYHGNITPNIVFL